MKALNLIIPVIFLIICQNCFAQVEETVERMAENEENETDFAELQEQWMQLVQHPVNLNAAGEEDLLKIPGISLTQVRNLLDYRNTYQEFFSVYELMAVAGFDSLKIQKIQPYIFIKPVSDGPVFSIKNLFRYSRQSILIRYGQTFPSSQAYQTINPKTGAPIEPVYPGSPQHYYFRYAFSWSDKIQIGLAGEKDAGEQFFRGRQSLGMDYYSGYISLSNIGILKNLTLGTFRAGFGQGLTFSSGSSMGSFPGFLSNISYSGGVRGSTSVSEYRYLKGLCATFKIKKLEITGFFSSHRMDGNVTQRDSITGKVLAISSIQETGYHRTKAEKEDQNALSELLCGGNINYTGKFYKLGMSGYYSKWSAKLLPAYHPYNQFSFSGNENFALGLDYQFRFRFVYLFGEVTRCLNGKTAFIAGLNAEPDTRVRISIIYRNYPSGFQNLYSNAFGQQSSNSNETGIYAGIKADLHPKLTVSAYADIYEFPWLRYRNARPGIGFEFGILLTSPLLKTLSLSGKYFYSEGSVNTSAENGNIWKIVNTNRHNLRIQADVNLLPELNLRSRIEFNQTAGERQPNRSGYLIFQDIQYKPIKFPAGGTFRYSLFDIPTYAERIYTYEPEVLYGFSVPAFYGKGMRVCLLINGKVTKKLRCWVKGAMTRYFDRQVIGSGNNSIQGQIRWDLTVQLMLNL